MTVDVIGQVYETGRKCAKGFTQNMKTVVDDLLPKWHYQARPAVT